MEITVYFFGKKSDINPWEEDIIRKIKFSVALKLIPLPQAGLKEKKSIQKQESQNLIKRIKPSDFLIACHQGGENFDSLKFASWHHQVLSQKRNLNYVIGGAYGLDESILSRADLLLSFGDFTWTRNLSRLMLLEQIYRNLEINQGKPFHK